MPAKSGIFPLEFTGWTILVPTLHKKDRKVLQASWFKKCTCFRNSVLLMMQLEMDDRVQRHCNRRSEQTHVIIVHGTAVKYRLFQSILFDS